MTARLRGWIAEAGDFRVEPRPEYLEHVRQALLERVVVPQEPVIPPQEVETPLGIGLAGSSRSPASLPQPSSWRST